MSEYDLIVRNGRVISSEQDSNSDIGVRDGRIAVIGHITGAADNEIDATGKIVTPGGVDPHCHIEQMSGMGLMNADTFETATRSAALGGTTTTISFAPQTAASTLAEAVEDYAERAKRGSFVDYAFHIIVNDPAATGALQDLHDLIQAGHRSIKVFTTYNIQLSDREICEVLSVAKKAGALVCVHAENDGLIGWTKDRLLAQGKLSPAFHAVSHPKLAEIEAVERLIRFAEFFATPIMLFHISTREAAEAVRRARRRGTPVWAETCPHYLFMTANDLVRPGLEGAKWMCSPPQRTSDDQTALWEALADDTLSLVSSDHAPYRFDDSGKLSAGTDADFSQIANGLPGLETRLPLMFDAMVSNDRLGGQAFVNTCCTSPARIYGLPNKGDILPGLDADLVIWDPEKKVTFGP
ncbi:MAG: dihydropyrimidinase, partial [Boseongicola sp.]